MPTMYRYSTERKKEPCCLALSQPDISSSKGLVVPAEMPSRTARRLQDFFERTVAVRPDNLALVCGSERLRYADLDAKANQLAQYLARLGVQPGDHVGLLLERTLHTYVALLGVLKCGAAFVPLDSTFPAERIAFIAEDANLKRLLTTTDFKDATGGVCCPVTVVDAETAAIARELAERLPLPKPDDALAYIIYTSGTTGRPKGVAVTHASICNFLTVCAPIYDVTEEDRVYQGMTLAFDFSIEEVWPTFAAGATLVAGPTDHRRLGSGLTEFLIEQEISVLCCVPTLLATVERDLPSLRTLLVGGEACPVDLVKRWSQPGRRMLNTYGPTETSVTATWTELWPDKPVTIGRPMPTYTVHILDDNLQPVPPGEAGEICIGGPGVAVGYVNRPELTAEKFVHDPFSDRHGARLYRTGDLGRLTFNEEIEYLGRIDTQVKIRGYRIELTEIEAILLENAAVANTIVALVSGEGGVQELAAYIVPRGRADFAELRQRLQATLRLRLPAYMVPAYIEPLDAVPMLPSNKADRSRLPRPAGPRLTAGAGNLDGTPPETPLEREITAAWSRVFGQEIRSVEADFFFDLGGHSLFAAQAVSDLRHSSKLHHLAIADLYAHPTIRGLAQHLEKHEVTYTGAAVSHGERLRHSSRRVWTAGAGQMTLLYFFLIPWLAPTTLLVLLFAEDGLSPGMLTACVTGCVAAAPLLALLLPVAAKWLLLGRVRPGRYPLWGWFFCRWWLVRRLLQAAPLEYLAGSPLLAPYLRLLGARIGRGCHLGSPRLDLLDLVEIGDGVSIGYDVDIDPCHVANGWLHLIPVRVGAGAYIGANSVLAGGGVVGYGARVAEQSLVASGQTIPDGETWAGAPARRVATDAQLDAMAALQPPSRWPLTVLAGFVLGFLLLILLPSILLIPGLVLLWGVSEGHLGLGLALTPAAGLLHVLFTCGTVAAGKRLAVPSARPGIYPLRSAFGLRKWLADRLMILSLTTTNSLYSTLYLLPFLRLLGTRVGSRAEVSTVSHIDPDLLTLGAECFVADLAVIGAARFHNGFVMLGKTEVGARGFVGNAALVPGDTRLAHDSLIGVLSVAPPDSVEPGSSWLGSPAIFLPRRQVSEKFDESLTFRPPLRLVLCRLLIEFLRVVLPSTLNYVAMFLMVLTTLALADALPLSLVVLLLPVVYFGAGGLVTGVTAALKWLVMGRYRPRVEPQYSHFVWRTELITGLYENVAVPWVLHWLAGTPLMAPALRLFGARLGRRVFMETHYLTEFDLVQVGDDATVCGQTSLQTHLFEDRVMKMSTLTIGSDCTIGPRAVVLYDAELEAGAELDALSLAMKGETLPAATRWRGIPARLVE
jgi:non-ribosomal peptide synthetase-like protein